MADEDLKAELERLRNESGRAQIIPAGAPRL
jgi:hypothetical protein